MALDMIARRLAAVVLVAVAVLVGAPAAAQAASNPFAGQSASFSCYRVAPGYRFYACDGHAIP